MVGVRRHEPAAAHVGARYRMLAARAADAEHTVRQRGTHRLVRTIEAGRSGRDRAGRPHAREPGSERAARRAVVAEVRRDRVVAPGLDALRRPLDGDHLLEADPGGTESLERAQARHPVRAGGRGGQRRPHRRVDPVQVGPRAGHPVPQRVGDGTQPQRPQPRQQRAEERRGTPARRPAPRTQQVGELRGPAGQPVHRQRGVPGDLDGEPVPVHRHAADERVRDLLGVPAVGQHHQRVVVQQQPRR